MAVYTEVSAEDLSALLAQYDIGTLSSLKGIAEGVENSNFILETIGDGASDAGGTATAGRTAHQRFILTLYEKRVDPADLPFFLGLMEHLARNGLNCPLPVRARTGSALARLAGKPAAIITFLDGVSYRRPSVAHCAELGRALARLHRAGADFPMRRANALALAGWRPLAERAGARADDVAQGLGALIADELAFLDANWPKNLPQGIIHADLFPNNVLFLGDKLTGVIDFYFACTDFYAYDLAICLNAWCFEADFSYNITKGAAMIAAYLAERPLTPGEIAALPVLARGAALRFLLTRLVDWLNVPAGALVKPLDPLDYMKRLRFHRRTADAAGYGA